MARRPSFQFYPQDWLGSPLIAAMSAAEEGAYIRLLCYCWNSEDCSLPDQDDVLARIGRIDEGYLKVSSSLLRKCFVSHPDKKGFLTNERLLFERKKQDEWKKKCEIAGKKSGEARNIKASNKLKVSSILVPTKIEGRGELNVNSSTSSSSSKVIDIKNISITSQKNLGDFVLPNFLPNEIFQNFLSHRRKLKKPMTDHAQKLLIKKLTKFHEQGNDVVEIINESILRGWLSVFLPNQQPTKGSENGNSNSNNRNKTKSEQSWQWYEQQLKESANTENIFCNENDVPIKI